MLTKTRIILILSLAGFISSISDASINKQSVLPQSLKCCVSADSYFTDSSLQVIDLATFCTLPDEIKMKTEFGKNMQQISNKRKREELEFDSEQSFFDLVVAQVMKNAHIASKCEFFAVGKHAILLTKKEENNRDDFGDSADTIVSSEQSLVIAHAQAEKDGLQERLHEMLDFNSSIALLQADMSTQVKKSSAGSRLEK